MSNPIHYPANPDRFEFDEHVAEIFPNMADRSIPNYRQMHALHAKILVDDYQEKSRWPENGTYSILDIGASRAEFFDALTIEVRERELRAFNVDYIACDVSKPMIDRTLQDRRMLKYLQYDLADPTDDKFSWLKFDAICMHYVMQFIPREHRTMAFARLGSFLKPDGILFWGEKETLQVWNKRNKRLNRISEIAQEYYIDFRVVNGYTRKEIEAKTQALKGSMWEDSFELATKPALKSVGFDLFIPTTRIGLFHSFIALKGY